MKGVTILLLWVNLSYTVIDITTGNWVTITAWVPDLFSPLLTIEASLDLDKELLWVLTNGNKYTIQLKFLSDNQCAVHRGLETYCRSLNSIYTLQFLNIGAEVSHGPALWPSNCLLPLSSKTWFSNICLSLDEHFLVYVFQMLFFWSVSDGGWPEKGKMTVCHLDPW